MSDDESLFHHNPGNTTEHCISCQVELCHLDDDPNGDRNPVCARCRAEEDHDFDADPHAKFDRSGNYVEPDMTMIGTEEVPMAMIEAAAKGVRSDLLVLCGDEAGFPSMAWQDVAGTCVTNMQILARWMYQQKKNGETDPGTVAKIAALAAGRE